MYLEQDISISSDIVHKYNELALARFNCAVKELRRIFLVEDLVDSLKVSRRTGTCFRIFVGVPE